MISFAGVVLAQSLDCTPAAGGQGINTAIGCIPRDNQTAFIAFILRWAMGIAGGVALLLIVYAAFLYITSSGDPKKAQAAQELLTSAIAGLLMLVLSLFLLRIIGINILGLQQIST